MQAFLDKSFFFLLRSASALEDTHVPSGLRGSKDSNVACRDMMRFFFQAEDGIRDYKVTGVQTCALPILSGGRGTPTSQPTRFNAAFSPGTPYAEPSSLASGTSCCCSARAWSWRPAFVNW